MQCILCIAALSNVFSVTVNVYTARVIDQLSATTYIRQVSRPAVKVLASLMMVYSMFMHIHQAPISLTVGLKPLENVFRTHACSDDLAKVVSCACVLVSRGLNVGRSSESVVSQQLSVTGGCRWCTSFKFFILQLWSVFVAFCTSLSIREINRLIQTLAWGASNRIGCVFELMKQCAVQDCPYWLVKTSVH